MRIRGTHGVDLDIWSGYSGGSEGSQCDSCHGSMNRCKGMASGGSTPLIER